MLLSLSQQGGTCLLSDIRVTTVSDLAGTGPVTLTKQHAAKAWARWSMAGTAANKDSFNISSFTDITTGVCKQQLASAMSDANYSATGCAGEESGGGNRACGIHGSGGRGPTASNTHFRLSNSSWAAVDETYGAAVWNGNLA